jgi:hypothetical protein
MIHSKSFSIHRIVFNILFLVFTIGAVEPTFAEHVDSGVPGMIFEHNVAVTMTDGVQLRVNIYRPEKPGHYPVLMSMGPYGKDSCRDSRLEFWPSSLDRHTPGLSIFGWKCLAFCLAKRRRPRSPSSLSGRRAPSGPAGGDKITLKIKDF